MKHGVLPLCGALLAFGAFCLFCIWLLSGCGAAPSTGPQPSNLGAYTEGIAACVKDSTSWPSYDACTDAVGRKFGFYDAGGQ